ncbi:MAG TPA: ABC transporter substrate-binding protein [Stellaceae bacterium]|nr:ABC transporter substrate-binding protein [Stellaceae bacterium]
MRVSVAARLCALVVLVLADTAAAQSPGPSNKVVVATGFANDYLATWVAQDRGFATQRGIAFDITLSQATGTDLAASLYANNVQIAQTTATTFALANENGLDLVIVAGAGIQTEVNPRQVLVRPAAHIKSAKDFAGKRVGTPGINGALDIMFRKWLAVEGVDPKSVNYVETPMPRMADLMKEAQVDAVLPVEPFRTRMIQAGVATPAGDYITSVNKVTLLSFYISTRKWAEANPQAIAAFRDLLKEGEDYVKAHPDDARAIEAKYLKLPSEIVAQLPFTATEVEVPPSRLQFWLDVCKQFGVTKDDPDAAKFIVK